MNEHQITPIAEDEEVAVPVHEIERMMGNMSRGQRRQFIANLRRLAKKDTRRKIRERLAKPTGA